MEYEDNPDANLTYLRTLDKDSLRMYVKGYLMACIHMREALSRGKLDLLNELLAQTKNKTCLTKQLGLLDEYENQIHKKELKLIRIFPEIRPTLEKL